MIIVIVGPRLRSTHEWNGISLHDKSKNRTKKRERKERQMNLPVVMSVSM